MVVQHNLTAMNANRMLGVTTSAQSKSTEKLSSGYKINRAADDAAGLSISEKMRKQMRGLTQASSNAQDGISAVQTAEGALSEVQDMLQRMNELAVKASNGTNSETDRQSIQDEIDQLTTEIDRVAETTKFNESYLLKGDAFENVSDKEVNAHDAGIKGNLVDNGDGTATFSLKKDLTLGDKIDIAGKQYTIGESAAATVATTDGYGKLASAAAGQTLGDTAVGVGDKIMDASAGKTYEIVNKAVYNAGTQLVKDAAFTITHADGTTESYTIDDGTGGAGKISADDAKAVVDQALANGEKVVLDTFSDGAGGGGSTTKDAGYELVKNLVNDSDYREISIVDAAFAATQTVADFRTATGVTLAEDDVISVSGEETKLTKNAPATADAVKQIVSTLKEGDTVELTRGTNPTKTFKVGEKTDDVLGTYSVEDILKNLQDGDQVKISAAAGHNSTIKLGASLGINVASGAADTITMLGDIPKDDENAIASGTISKEQAYELIKDELAKASSIGTDAGKEATVTNDGEGKFTITKGKAEVTDALSFSLHVGADADMTNKITVDIATMGTAGLGVKGIDVVDQTGIKATYAIDSIEDAIKSVSAQRSTLGAVQNRLEHTIKNLDNVVENTTSAESAIRDTDMATQMVEHSNMNILAQAGTSMLAQANQSNQNILSLLG